MTTITIDRAVLEQALEAMDKATRFMSDSDYVKLNQAIDALRASLPCTYKCEAWPECACAALAQQEQEPVAWRYQNSNTDHVYLVWEKGTGGRNWTPLYTHQPRREWRELTDEEIRATYGKDLKYRDGDYERFARAIEQALKEKNNG